MAQIPVARLRAFQRPFTFFAIDIFGALLVTVERRKRVFMYFMHPRLYCLVKYIRTMVPTLKQLKESSKKRSNKLIFPIYHPNLTKLNGISAHQKGPTWAVAWERLIRSVKIVLYSLCSTLNFNDETLKSALCKIKFIINS